MTRELTAVVCRYPHTEALLAGPLELTSGMRVLIRPAEEVPGGLAAVAARQVRQIPDLDFDIAELPVLNYLSALAARDASLRALPVFLSRRFVHDMLRVNRAVIGEPRQLEGRRIGLLYHGHTDAVWLRGILAADYGVDLSKVTWVTALEEQVEGALLPGNVVHVPRTDITAMLEVGELDGQVMNPRHKEELARGEAIGPLWVDPAGEATAWHAQTGLFPILHTVVVKEHLLEELPSLGAELFDAFVAAWDAAIVRAASAPFSSAEAERAEASGFPGPPAGAGAAFVAYGLDPNRAHIETLVRLARLVGVLGEEPPAEALFLPLG